MYSTSRYKINNMYSNVSDIVRMYMVVWRDLSSSCAPIMYIYLKIFSRDNLKVRH